MPNVLRGMTWDHPRGLNSLIASAAEWEANQPDVQIAWVARSLQAFADHALGELAYEYDLLVIDHPHVPAAASQGHLAPLDGRGRDDELAALAEQSVGPSHTTYACDGRQWALAVDAAAQVGVHRPDLLPDPPGDWDAVLEFASSGRMLWPAKPIDAIASFFTVAANRGTPVAASEANFIAEGDGLAVLEVLHRLADAVPPWCLNVDPIEVAEAMSTSDEYSYAPLLFGYSNYGRPGFRPKRLGFFDIPAGVDGPNGSCLGGAGIAVSAHSSNFEVAADFAFWVCAADAQRGVYYDGGGQPGNALAWHDPHINEDSLNFFKGTWETLDRSWVRPRYEKWLDVQAEAGDIIVSALRRDVDDVQALRRIEAVYARSREDSPTMRATG